MFQFGLSCCESPGCRQARTINLMSFIILSAVLRVNIHGLVLQMHYQAALLPAIRLSSQDHIPISLLGLFTHALFYPAAFMSSHFGQNIECLYSSFFRMLTILQSCLHKNKDAANPNPSFNYGRKL